MSLLEQDITNKGQVDENNGTKLDIYNKGNEYKVEAIWDSAVYAKKLAGHLLGLYYLIF